MKHREQIFQLRKQGFSYKQIVKKLGCSLGTVAYHLSINGKNKAKIRKSKIHPCIKKLQKFIYSKPILGKKPTNSTARRRIYEKLRGFFMTTNMKDITIEQLLNHFGDNPTCYLTGEPIDLNKPGTYEFDHIIPISRGGENTLANLGLCTKTANRCKYTLTKEEFILFCKKVVDNQGV